MADRYHVSSLIIWVKPGRFIVTRAEIRVIPGIAIVQTDGEAKLVVTLETHSPAQTAERLRAIEALSGVLNVSLVYQHVRETAKPRSKSRRPPPLSPRPSTSPKESLPG